MGTGAVYMEEEKKKYCQLCKTEMTSSYFLRVDIELLEVCPECHHHYVYSPEDILEKYKERRNIK